MRFNVDDRSFLACSLCLFTAEPDNENRSVMAPTRTVEPARKLEDQNENAPTRTFGFNEHKRSFLVSSQCLTTDHHAVKKIITKSDPKSHTPPTKTVCQSENAPIRIRIFILMNMTPVFHSLPFVHWSPHSQHIRCHHN